MVAGGDGRILEVKAIYWDSAQCRRVFSFTFETCQTEVDLRTSLRDIYPTRPPLNREL